MIIWLDAHISPALARWLQSTFKVEAYAVRDLNLAGSTDQAIFAAARSANAVVITKDSDFVALHYINGAPPQIIWLTCGNTSNHYLKSLLESTFPQALKLLEAGEGLVEIRAL
jgi:predicted nuclease of predicted toxin-antitoxin system